MADKNKETNDTLVGETVKDILKDKNTATGKSSDRKNSPLFYVLTILTALILVALIIGSIMFLAVKNNVNGMADNMGDSIEKIPVLKLALPKKPEPEDEKNMTEEQVRQKYTEIKANNGEMEKQIEELTSQVDSLNEQLSAKDTNSSLQQQQKDALEKEKEQLTTDNAALKKDFDDLSAVIAKGDPAEYKKYFEKTNPAIASDLYEKVLTDEKMSAEVKKYVSIYESMDAGAVAGILEQMGTGKMTLIIEIMKNLKKDTSGDILTEMTPEFASKVSEELAKVYKVGEAAADSTK